MSKLQSTDRLVSPVVLGGYCEESPDSANIFRCLAGLDGVIVSGCIETETLPKGTDSLSVSITVENRDGTGKSESILAPKGKGEIETKLSVNSMSKITISTDCVEAKGIWTAIVIRPNAEGKFIQRIEHDEPTRVLFQSRTKAATHRNKEA